MKGFHMLLALASCSRSSPEPLAVGNVRVAPAHHDAGGILEIDYDVRGAGTLGVETTCQIGAHNLLYAPGEAAAAAGARTAAFRPDPFHETASMCQIVFRSGERVLATACWRGGAVAMTACPSFPPPPRRGGTTVELDHVGLELKDGAATVTALFTRFEPPDPTRRFAGRLRCDDAHGTASGEGAFAFVPLDRMAAGTSAYGPLAILLDRTPSPDATCELAIVSRATSGGVSELVHAIYCIRARAGVPQVDPGACG